MAPPLLDCLTRYITGLFDQKLNEDPIELTGYNALKLLRTCKESQPIMVTANLCCEPRFTMPLSSSQNDVLTRLQMLLHLIS
ncbi:hypothetical protein D3C78_1470580 [compost metagenome]